MGNTPAGTRLSGWRDTAGNASLQRIYLGGLGERRGVEEGVGQIQALTTPSSPLEHIEAPVHCVEEDERQREHHPRVFVDNVDVLDGGYGALDGRGAFLERGDDSLSVGGAGGVDAGASRERVVAINAERRWELEVLHRALTWEEFGVVPLPEGVEGG